ncbi:MAG: CoA pyrophosphatase [Myxococcota bacterium]
MNPQSRLFEPDLRTLIQERLDGFPFQEQRDPELRPAAVALVITPNEKGEACFLITRRTAHLKRHARQWALPGGRLDAGETEIEAALRETHEEVGIALPKENVLGRLDDFATRSGFRMTPIVVWADEAAEPVPDPNEVEQVHIVPLNVLEKPEVPVLREIPESDRPVLSVPMLGTLIHSPTAAILFQMREVLLAGRHTRVAHYEQPVFAWK